MIGRLMILLVGLFYVPSMIYSFSGISKKGVNSFIKGLVLYVLLPLITIAIAIIYLYIAKIILLKDMPQNTIYRILASIFVVAFPVWNMAKNYQEEKPWLGKIAKGLPYVYAPFILLEIYSIGTRIQEFGVTPMRYVSCLFIVFQIMVLFLTFYRKGEKIEYLFMGTVVLVVILFVSPWHYENVSNWSQKGILERLMPENTSFDSLSEVEKGRVSSAYEYLKYEEKGKKCIPSYLSEEEKAKIEEYSKFDNRDTAYPLYVSVECELELALEEYSKITYVSGGNEQEKKAIIQLKKSGREIDLTDKIEELIHQENKNQMELEEDFAENNMVRISETEDLYISRCSFSYDKTQQKFNYLRVEGYILER